MVQELLGQCQEGAIRIGDLIESSEEGETKTIELLEEYCRKHGVDSEKARTLYTDYEQITERVDTWNDCCTESKLVEEKGLSGPHSGGGGSQDLPG